jgi:valyl-tRNA synthetase
MTNQIEFPKKYNHKDVEAKWQQHWLEQKIYKWDENTSREEVFSIDTPPPTVSGLLHMGHIFSYTQADFIARFMRMIGKNVFYPMGFDDNGLPTERLVEKTKKVRAGNMPREEFIELCKEVVVSAEEEFRELFRHVALSVDWEQEYQTISPESRTVSQMSFLDLFEKGLVSRRDAPTFWDPVDRTAIAQAEIEDKEKQGMMNDITFKLEDGGDITIATTRPEMLAACQAVFYHPEDQRYQHLAGKFALTPIYNKRVPLLADEDVSQEKGSGLVMCCTFGDIQDIEWWRKHKLGITQVIGLNGRMENSGKYDGMKVEEARAAIIEHLLEDSTITAQKEVEQVVKCAERSGAILEIIPTHQWYVAIMEHKEKLLAKADECKWFPDYMRIRLENWINGLNQDWCISRQRYFGVPFPVWYSKRPGEEGKILVASPDQLPVDPLVDLPKGYSADEVEPDEDVMDTWATSSVSPQLNSRTINENFALDLERHQKLFPFDLRPQAHEIIRTWAFYTIVKAMHHEDSIPWQNLMISGWCLAKDKSKMSKSKGNVVQPQRLLDEKGSDAVRYWASTSKLGADTAYSEDTIKIGKKLITKLWNASKFAAIHLTKVAAKPVSAQADLKAGHISETLDKWIISRLRQTLTEATAAFEKFEYCDARVAVENFFWKDFCDNYLELVKQRAYDPEGSDRQGQISAAHTIHHCLHTLVRLFAPFLPHICDELNAIIFAGEGSVNARNSWPQAQDFFMDEAALTQGEHTVALLELVRMAKSAHNVSIKRPVDRIEYSGCELDTSSTEDFKHASNAAISTSAAVVSDNLDGVYNSDCGNYNLALKLGAEEDERQTSTS